MARTIKGVELSDRTIAYLETVLWAETVTLSEADVDEKGDCTVEGALNGARDGDPLDDYFGVEDFAADSLRKAENELNDFFGELVVRGLDGPAADFADDDRIAHDFWLTRNGHGAGFWDGDYDGPGVKLGRTLSDIAKGYGEQWVVLGDDNELHIY